MSVAFNTLPPGLAAWRSCPTCCSTLAVVPGEQGANPHVECPDCGRAYHGNPKPTVSALVERGDGRLLLVRRAIEPFLDRWDTPGGFLEEGERPEDAVARELKEETDIDITVGRIAGAWIDRYGSDATTVNLFYTATATDVSRAAPASDVSELDWFAVEELPAREEIAFDCVPHAIEWWRTSVRTRTRGQ